MNTAKASVLQFHKPGPEAVSSLVQEGAALKARIDSDTARLREINRELAEQATFPDGKNTAKIEENGVKATIQLKTYTKYDQEKLDAARRAMGNEAFLKPFTYEFKPRSKKDLDAFLAYGDPAQTAMVRDAMTITEGAPQVTYEQVG